jgi:uncharacterized RDD family membrane protein YckC
MHETPEPRTDEPHCGLLRRLLAMTYDGLVVLALLMIATLVALPVTGTDVRAGRHPGFTLYLLGVWFAYVGSCWRYSQATLGMRAWRIRLVGQKGAAPGWRACGLRFGVAFASALAGGLGFAWAVFNRQRRCWHDLASGTDLLVRAKGSDRAAKHQDGG